MTTGIDYLDETWNPITGCSGNGCKAHCWARTLVKRFPHLHGADHIGDPDRFSYVQFHPECLDNPIHWKRPRRIGVCFMGDLFDEQVPMTWISEVYHIMEQTHIQGFHHQFFVLTKQPRRMFTVLDDWHNRTRYNPPSFIWHGVSITDQEDADRMIPELLKIPGNKWLSLEPMLGPINLLQSFPMPGTVKMESWPSWVVLGCESRPNRRPCPQEWMIDVVRQCEASGVPVWVKQVDVGKWVSHDPAEWPEDLMVRERP